MATQVKIPEVGESITEVQVSQWLKSEGDDVKQDESLAVIESEKTTFELPSPASGKLSRIISPAGSTAKIGEIIGEIGGNGNETVKVTPGKAAEELPQAKQKESAMPAQEGTAKPEEQESGRRVTAEKTKTNGTPEKSGRPRGQSVASGTSNAAPVHEQKAEKEKTGEPESPTDFQPAATETEGREQEIIPMTMLRRTIARRLVDAVQNMAMLTTFNEVDMSAINALRAEYGETFLKRHETKLGLMSFFTKAVIDGLKRFAELNAEVRGTDIVFRDYYDIGVAIATDQGLVVPVVRNADQLSFAELEKTIGDYANRARAARLKPEELSGGTFTITNGGVFGSLLSTPIINPPQSGILGMHTIQQRPVAFNGQVVIRPMMYLALTYDHRIVDGREAVLFLRRVKEVIESPTRMLIEA